MIVRRGIINSDDRLRERELLKSARLAAAIELALVDEGVEPAAAALVAPFGVLVFDIALTDWLDAGADTARPLPEVLRSTLVRLRALMP